MKEYGFWDYTTPGAGGMERYGRDDYLSLLEDMATAGMNSLMICVKWFTTGYRSSLPFLDQVPENPVIASDNEILRMVIREAHRRGIKIWLGACLSYFPIERFGLESHNRIDRLIGHFSLPEAVGAYATDIPEVVDRAAQVADEIVELFPEADGLEIELEDSGIETPSRISYYNAWAKDHDRPPFDQLRPRLNPRDFDVPEWREYTTYSRTKLLKQVEKSVRGKGFSGDLAMICETGVLKYAIFHEVDLAQFKETCPGWNSITYHYDKWLHRHAMMEFCVDLPQRQGLRVYYLARGIMTWSGRWPLPIHLEESWRRDVEDVREHQPDGFWWFGSGSVGEGPHVSSRRLKEVGHPTGTEARRALLEVAKDLSPL